ncbi:helix-turn-helix domain-containing protein [Streptomyces triticirhizae]|uniref:XRE family transcriptional regulator n=1 Tax=Streptomyces triticirhizae TaxID=2483353 RepID=A0A3M2LPZ2_9ACTN|nr:helix-turn-helix transcriptional regulator [Streptomyces triticirhizae]RMI39531.1 XRE family transcriptional regulator [Streptomyces triticirhizae]
MSNTYGEWLRSRREGAGLTQQELAERAIMTRSHISHIEAGRRVPSPEDARRLDKALNTGDVLSTFLPRADEGGLADYFEPVRALQQQATMIREFAISYIPGLLQTEAYARAVLGSAFPPVGEEERDRRVVARVERSRLLDDPVTPVLWALIDEAALRRVVGGPEVMAEQIDHLVRLTEAGRIRTHVMPLKSAYELMEGTLSLMWFEDQPPCAYSEGHAFGRLHDAPAVVERLQAIYDLALGEALPQEDSVALMRAIAKDHVTP